MCDTYIWRKAKYIHKRQPIFSSERMLHKVYIWKGSVEKKICGRESQGVWREDELNGANPPVVK
jgi:hypothetical protein